MDYEYDDEPLEGRVLWGRIAVYGVAFALVFLLGNCMGGGDGGTSEADLEELTEQVRTLASENTVLEQQLAAATAGQGASTTGSDDTSAGEPETEGGGTPTGDGGNGQAGGESGDGGDSDGGDDGGDDGDDGEAAGTETYTVRSGDSLYAIATEFYGDGSKWRLIAEANGLDDDNRLTVGQELRIPPDS